MKKSFPLKIGVVGASGLVGQTLLKLLDGADALSARSLELNALTPYNVLFFATESAVAKEWIPQLAAQGVLCIDKSSAFRDHSEVPLVVPEINGSLLRQMPQPRIISSPNCVAIPLALVLHPLRAFGIKRVIVSTYQSVSGAGRPSLERFALEMAQSPIKNVEDFLQQGEVGSNDKIDAVAPLALNVIPQIGSLDDQQNSEEEVKVAQETQRILQTKFPVSLTCVRVPTWVGHSLSVSIEFDKPGSSLADIKGAFQNQVGLVLSEFPLTARHGQGKSETFVSRVRPCPAFEKGGISLWATTDNLMKGAALNALQILEACYQQNLFSTKQSLG